jgi:transmembrane sensor
MNAQIRDTAAEWLVEFRTGKPGIVARRQFAAWLCASPEHITAYLNALALWEEASCYDRQHRLDIDALIEQARTDPVITDLPTVYTVPGSLAPQRRGSLATVSQKTLLGRLLGPRTGIAVLLSLAINCGLWWIAIDARNDGFTTQIAEQRSVVLSDGSHVDLDALSNVRVKFTSHERTVELLSGQAIFHVTMDPKRPFVVRADGARFRAVGTKFDVNRTTMGTVLTVLEGRVTVLIASGFSWKRLGFLADSDTSSPRSRPAATGAQVDVGQQVTVFRGTVTTPQTIDTAVVTGWTRKLLVFASTPLPLVAEELNRFNFRQLAVASPELIHFEVTGTFRAGDPETLTSFVLFLRRQPQLEVLEHDDQITIQFRPAH